MTSFSWWIFCIVLLAGPVILGLLLKWIFIPIRLRRRNPIPIRVKHELTTEQNLTPEMRDAIGKYVRQFADAGFTVAANFFVSHGPGEARGVQVMFVDRKTNDMGAMIFVTAKLTRNTTFAIRSIFADGSEVATGCNREIGFMPDDPNVQIARFSWASDVATLAEAHRRWLKKLERDQDPRIAPAPGEELEFADARSARERARFVKVGYFYRDEQAGMLRKTLKGTFLVPWKLMQPVKRWRIRHRDRQARRLWNELGMNEWKPPAKPDAADMIQPSGTVSMEGVDAPLAYSVQLPSGELRVSQESGATVIRLGQPSKVEYLLFNWDRILGIVLYAFGALAFAVAAWARQRVAILTGRPSTSFGMFDTLAVCLFVSLSIAQCYSLIRRVRRVGGTAQVVASHAGLHYQSAPGQVRSGFIRRDDVRNLLITVHEAHLGTTLHQLGVLPRGAEPNQPILVALRKSVLQEARNAMVAAMGIVPESMPADQFPVPEKL